MILIFSQTSDNSTNKVCSWLNYYHVPFIRINEKLPNLEIKQIKISSNNTCVLFEYEGQQFTSDSITCVWFRRGHFKINIPNSRSYLLINDAYIQKEFNSHLSQEAEVLIDYVYYILYSVSINSSNLYNLNKLISLEKAKKVGLQIPNTIIDTNTDFMKSGENFITKNLQDVVFVNNEKDWFITQTVKKIENTNINETFFLFFKRR